MSSIGSRNVCCGWLTLSFRVGVSLCWAFLWSCNSGSNSSTPTHGPQSQISEENIEQQILPKEENAIKKSPTVPPPVVDRIGGDNIPGNTPETPSGSGGNSEPKPPVQSPKAAPLFEFSGFRFTTAGSKGAEGPTLEDLKRSYSNQSWSTNADLFSVPIRGIQVFTVPQDGLYQFRVAGAAGGSVSTNCSGGAGRIIGGKIPLERGAKLMIIVGQKGEVVPERHGGGGGGTYVFLGKVSKESTLLVGGGGGGSSCGSDPVRAKGKDGNDRSFGTIGTIDPNMEINAASGGENGSPGKGGKGSTPDAGGLVSASFALVANDPNQIQEGGDGEPGLGGTGGTDCVTGFFTVCGGGGGGGVGDATSTFRGGTPGSHAAAGGFGGGGSSGTGNPPDANKLKGTSAFYSGGGGGAGYSGGGGGNHWVTLVYGGGGGGGGSFAGSLVTDYNRNVGLNPDDGFVEITRL